MKSLIVTILWTTDNKLQPFRVCERSRELKFEKDIKRQILTDTDRDTESKGNTERERERESMPYTCTLYSIIKSTWT